MTHWSFMAIWCCALPGGDPPVRIVIEPDAASAASTTSTPHANAAAALAPLAEKRQSDVVAKLQLQRAIRDARAAIDAARFDAAIDLLEPLLESADGNAQLLDALEAAYRGQLAIALRGADAGRARAIAERLRVLAPGYNKPVPVQPTNEQQTRAPKSQPNNDIDVTANAEGAQTSKPRAITVVRGKLDEATEAKSSATTSSSLQPSPGAERCNLCLQRAECCFRDKDYPGALKLYEDAYEADPVEAQQQRDHWGYCLLWCAVERYNGFVRPAGQTISDDKWQAIEEDCRLARRLAPSLEFTDTVLAAVQKARTAQEVAAEPASRRTEVAETANAPDVASTTTTPPAESRFAGQTVIVRQGAAGNGWSFAETENFRIFHREPHKVARVAELAESGRRRAHDKWFAGEALEPWSPKCDLTIYPTADEYRNATGVGIQSPGHSKTLNDRGRVTVRQLFIRSDDPNMMDAVLPHEVAHVVFAGKFDHHAVPRWADEGMAVLTEPMDKQEAHLRNLSELARRGQRFSCGQMLAAQDYPPGAQMRDFYAQSVGICRHLVERGGEAKLVQMLRSALRSGDYDLAIRQTYGNAGVAQLESDFANFVAGLSGGGSASALSYVADQASPADRR